MQVSFNPSVSFRDNVSTAAVEKPAQTVTVTQSIPPVEVKNKKNFRDTIGSAAKFFTSLGTMTKASLKAVFYGLIAGAGIIGLNWIKHLFKPVKNMSRIQTFAHPLKSMTGKGKFVTGIGALAVAAYHVVKGLLRTNQKTANVDHQLKIAHRDK